MEPKLYGPSEVKIVTSLDKEAFTHEPLQSQLSQVPTGVLNKVVRRAWATIQAPGMPRVVQDTEEAMTSFNPVGPSQSVSISSFSEAELRLRVFQRR
ncbi:tRNA (guanine(37)-N1)-methyltransferase [Lates japonicus]|uniref:tRNA (Guanine(37)-N1)-methyltransferase n=1 Tax=Lates japonicus TaxID=270547 RepID=A0AAD3R9P0_LATJO|nr:tRNA (guanine(37)-N1)-methyltransferase [Lates japonicus]